MQTLLEAKHEARSTGINDAEAQQAWFDEQHDKIPPVYAGDFVLVSAGRGSKEGCETLAIVVGVHSKDRGRITVAAFHKTGATYPLENLYHADHPAFQIKGPQWKAGDGIWTVSTKLTINQLRVDVANLMAEVKALSAVESKRITSDNPSRKPGRPPKVDKTEQ